MKAKITNDRKFIKVIEANPQELEQLKMTFTKKVDNWQWHPLVKKKLWDGNISFIQHGIYMPIGLWNEYLKMGQRFGITVELFGLEDIFNKIDREEFEEYFLKFFENSPKWKPYDYQIDAAYNILKYGLSSSEIATSAGKTFIVFLCFVWMKEKMGLNKMLMVVPKAGLVTQAIDDFRDYATGTGFQYLSKPITKGSKESIAGVNFVIGNYQTLVKRESEFFKGFDALVIDEAHGTGNASNKKIILQCNNPAPKIIFGLSGTLTEGDCTDFNVQSYLGPRIQNISSAFLTDNGYATKIKVKSIWLDYLEEKEKEDLHRLRVNRELDGAEMYNLERKVIIGNDKRFEFITNMISKVSKNSLVLFSDVQNNYGKRIYDRLRELCSDKEIFYIDGGTSETNRSYYKKRMEEGGNKIMVASFGTLSTGISIKNIHNIFFTESYKSEVIVKQSIGRGMRLHPDKPHVTIIDFVDNFTITKSAKGITAKHGEVRLEIYRKEGYQVEVLHIRL
jgi:superfamily II DNA or RNA helicase